jgi:purine-binding chemotaxis protein CheW
MDTVRALVFRVPGLLCALPIEHVVETLRPLPVETIAGMPPFVLGLSIIRGTATPVVDAATLLDGRRAWKVGRLVLVRVDVVREGPLRGPVDSRRVALAVEAVLGVRELAAGAISGLPPLLGGGGPHGVDALAALDRELLVVLAAGRFVPDDVWRATSAAEVRP